VGDHPNFPAGREAALELLGGRCGELEGLREAVEKSGTWDAFRMVDWCEEAAGREGPLSLFLRSLQSREIELLALRGV
jgi:hypothetical protein